MTRPLAVTRDPEVLDDLLRLAALAGVELDVAHDAVSTRRAWESAPCVVVGPDVVGELTRARLARRARVVVLGSDLADAGLWEQALSLGAERVTDLADAERALVDLLADAVEGGADSPVAAVVGGRGGAGATTLACALAKAASGRGLATLLVDGDPLGGGIDLVFAGEHEAGIRWPDLHATRGRVPAAALAQALPQLSDMAVLSWDRSQSTPLAPEAMQSVLAAGRRSHDLVVVDLPRHLDDAAREVLHVATVTWLVVPAEVRAVAAAAAVAAHVALACSDLRLVVRGPGPGGLTANEVGTALSLPVAAEMRSEPRLERAMEEGVAPGTRRGSPLSVACRRLLDSLVPVAQRRVS